MKINSNLEASQLMTLKNQVLVVEYPEIVWIIGYMQKMSKYSLVSASL